MIKFIVLSILILFTFSSCNSDKKKAETLYANAKEDADNQLYSKAILEIDSALFIDSSIFKYNLLKANLQAALGNFESSIQILKRMEINKIYLDTVYYNLGKVYFKSGNEQSQKSQGVEKENEQYQMAVLFYNKALSINPGYYDAYLGKSNAFHNKGEFLEAISVLTKAIKLFPDSLEVFVYLGAEKISLGDVDAGISDIEFAISKNKMDSVSSSEAHRWIGLGLKQKFNLLAAIKEFTKAIEFSNDNAFLYANRGFCYKELGFKNKACEDFRKTADLGYIIIYEQIKNYCN